MANVKFSGLPASAGLVDADLFAVTDDPAGTPASQKATAAQVADYVLTEVADSTTATSMNPTTDFLAAIVSGNRRKVTPTTAVQSLVTSGTLKSSVDLADRVLIGDSAASNVVKRTSVNAIIRAFREVQTETLPDDLRIAVVDDGTGDAISMPLRAILKEIGNAASTATFPQFTGTIDGAADRLFFWDADANAIYYITPNKLASGKHTVVLPVGACKPRSANGCAALATANGASNQPDEDYFAFDGAATEYAKCPILGFGQGWNASTIRLRFRHRRASGTGAANVVLGGRGLSVGSNESAAQNFGTVATVTAPCSTTTANWMWSDWTGALTIAGSPAKGDAVFLEFLRDGAAGGDTLNSVDCWISHVEIEYGTDARDDS